MVRFFYHSFTFYFLDRSRCGSRWSSRCLCRQWSRQQLNLWMCALSQEADSSLGRACHCIVTQSRPLCARHYKGHNKYGKCCWIASGHHERSPWLEIVSVDQKNAQRRLCMSCGKSWRTRVCHWVFPARVDDDYVLTIEKGCNALIAGICCYSLPRSHILPEPTVTKLCYIGRCTFDSWANINKITLDIDDCLCLDMVELLV